MGFQHWPSYIIFILTPQRAQYVEVDLNTGLTLAASVVLLWIGNDIDTIFCSVVV